MQITLPREIQQLPAVSAVEGIYTSPKRFIVLKARMASGKTLGLPAALYNLSGGGTSIITQPLVENTLGTPQYLSSLLGLPVGEFAGYATGEFKDYLRGDASVRTKLLYCTEALKLPQLLFRPNWFDYLFIDEVDQFTLAGESIMAWVLDHFQKGSLPFSKVILMSGTNPAEELAEYLGKNDTEIIEIETPEANIINQRPGNSIYDDIMSLLTLENYEITCFLPGRGEILGLKEQLEANSEFNKVAIALPFYRDMKRSELDKIYLNFNKKRVILATTALWTGKTIPLFNSDRQFAVIASGIHREPFFEQGVRGLHVMPDALMQIEQQRARTGRINTHIPGIWIDHTPERLKRYRRKYRMPETHTDDPTSIALKLMAAGYTNVDKLRFFHPMGTDRWTYAGRKLFFLDLVDGNNHVNPTGEYVTRLPLKPEYGKMVHRVKTDPNLRSTVIAIVAILETGSLKHANNAWQTYIRPGETSDILAELDLFIHAREVYHNLEEHGIVEARFLNVVNLFRRIHETLKVEVTDILSVASSDEYRKQVLEVCLSSFLEYVHSRTTEDTFVSLELGQEGRILDALSVAKDSKEKYIIGIPFTLGRDRRLIFNTPVSQELLLKIGVRWIRHELRNFFFDSQLQAIVCTKISYFRDKELLSERLIVPSPEQQDNAFADIFNEEEKKQAILALAYAFEQRQVKHPDIEENKKFLDEFERLRSRTTTEMVRMPYIACRQWFVEQLNGRYTVDECLDVDLRITNALMSQWLGIDYPSWKQDVLSTYPDIWQIGEKSFKLTYSQKFGKNMVELIVLPEMLSLEDQTLPEIPGYILSLGVAEEAYDHLRAETFTLLREKIEASRISQTWSAFERVNEKRVIHSIYDELPNLSEAVVYDDITGKQGFPAITKPYYPSSNIPEGMAEWVLRWFKTEEEAHNAQKDAEEKRQALIRKEQEKDLSHQAENELKTLQALYEEIKTLDPIQCGLRSSYELQEYGEKIFAIEKSCNSDPQSALSQIRFYRKQFQNLISVFEENLKGKDSALELYELVDSFLEELTNSTKLKLVEDSLVSSFTWTLGDYNREYIRKGLYTQSLEKLTDLLEKVQPEIDELRRYGGLLQEIWERDYHDCPFCRQLLAEKIGDFEKHKCPFYQLISQVHGGTFIALETYVGEDVLLRLNAEASYGEYNFKLELFPEINFHNVEEAETEAKGVSFEEIEEIHHFAEVVEDIWYRDYYNCPMCGEKFPENWREFTTHQCSEQDRIRTYAKTHNTLHVVLLETIFNEFIVLKLVAQPRGYTADSEFFVTISFGRFSEISGDDILDQTNTYSMEE